MRKIGGDPAPTRKRSLGVVECTLMGLGVMLGAGSYVLVGQAALVVAAAALLIDGIKQSAWVAGFCTALE